MEAGVRLVLVIDPKRGTAAAYRSLTDVTEIGVDGLLDGAEVVPGFQVRLGEILE